MDTAHALSAPPRPFCQGCQLLYLGRDYPKGLRLYFKERPEARLHEEQKDETDPEKIRTLVKRGDFVSRSLRRSTS
ncbi:unnamed protein product [Arctogadus glacialis]